MDPARFSLLMRRRGGSSPTDALRAPGIIYADESLIRDAEAGDNTCARYRIFDFSFIVSPSRLRATSLVDTHWNPWPISRPRPSPH